MNPNLGPYFLWFIIVITAVMILGIGLYVSYTVPQTAQANQADDGWPQPEIVIPGHKIRHASFGHVAITDIEYEDHYYRVFTWYNGNGTQMQVFDMGAKK